MSVDVLREIKSVEATAAAVVDQARQAATQIESEGQETLLALRRAALERAAAEAKSMVATARAQATDTAKDLLAKARSDADEVLIAASRKKGIAVDFVTAKVVD